MGQLWLFNFGAIPYDILTDQDFWRKQIIRTLDYVKEQNNLKILDVGCGPGVSTFALAEHLTDSHVTGIDCASRMIERARRHHKRRYKQLKNIKFDLEDASALSFADNSFDLVIGHSFIYLVKNRSAVLGEICRVLKPGGTAVFMEPNAKGSLFKAIALASKHKNELFIRPKATMCFAASMVIWRTYSLFPGRFTPDLLKQLFADAGFANFDLYPTLAGLGFHCVGRA